MPLQKLQEDDLVVKDHTLVKMSSSYTATCLPNTSHSVRALAEHSKRKCGVFQQPKTPASEYKLNMKKAK